MKWYIGRSIKWFLRGLPCKVLLTSFTCPLVQGLRAGLIKYPCQGRESKRLKKGPRIYKIEGLEVSRVRRTERLGGHASTFPEGHTIRKEISLHDLHDLVNQGAFSQWQGSVRDQGLAKPRVTLMAL